MNNLQQIDQATLIRYIEENLWEMWSTFGRGPGCSLYQGGGVLWFETPLPIIPYNGVLRFQVDAGADERLETILGHFRSKAIQFMWVLHPSSRPADLRQRLLERGLKYVEPIPGMARSLDDLPEIPPAPEGISVRQVTGERDSSAYFEFAAWRWNVPEQYQEQYADMVNCFHFG